ncbi:MULTISPECIES: EAL domain-containing protein [Halomonadaceae]|uniref:EAL domain-containing protein n=1 Tax=Halomonadaceae TaxID=28256 RepID=UPI0015985094|nr:MULTISPECIES: EAL domain-containing protein [Halomonas]QJQ94810.1 EAL domain-containing protein [Halomonas sp. PA5]
MSHCARHDAHCGRCDAPLPFDFTMAFQPIVDISTAEVTTYEALVRGLNGESAYEILSRITPEYLYRFDQACRIKAIELASQLEMQENLSINFLPNAVYEPSACIQATLAVSQRVGWPIERITFEITESEMVKDRQHLRHIIDTYRNLGFTTAIDDFGNGFANLDLLADLKPDVVKIDRELVMGCDQDLRRQAILRAVYGLADELGIALIAEGIETRQEALWLAHLGITRQQGFHFARPALESICDAGLGDFLQELRSAV